MNQSPLLPSECPRCAKWFRVDPSLQGGHATCPHCQSVVAIGNLSADAAAPASPQATQQADDSGASIRLNCPVCQGGFRTEQKMIGQEVLCPHCQSRVSVPRPGPEHDAPRGRTGEPQPIPDSPPTGHPPASSADDPGLAAPAPPLWPPGTGPVNKSETERPRAPGGQDAASGRTGESHPIADSPPIGHPPSSSTVDPGLAAPAPPLWPPGTGPAKKSETERPRTPRGEDAASGRTGYPHPSADSPPTGHPPSSSTGDPGLASPTPPVWPPGTGPANKFETEPPMAPIAGDQAMAPVEVSHQPGLQPDVVLDQTELSGIEIHQAPRTIKAGDQVIELRPLTPEEKVRQRLIKNIVVFVIGAGILIFYLLYHVGFWPFGR